MSTRLPALTARKVAAALKKVGFKFDHQAGSHAVFFRKADKRRVTVPMHGKKDLKRGTVVNIIQQAGLTQKDLVNLL